MKNNLISVLAQRYSKRRQHHRRQKWISFVACILVFCITYAALLPAVAQMAPYISKVFKNPGEPVYEYNPSGDNSSYTPYTYSDKDVDVQVLLPADSNVPKNAILRVTPIGTDAAQYSKLVKSAKDAVIGNVEQLNFYDLSFFTDKQVYIPVDDRAIVTINYRNPVIDPDAEIVVLHYDKNDEKPVTLDKVSFIERPVTSEQELIFETHGFSIFAVVEVQVQPYSNVTKILRSSQNTDLDGKILMISTADGYKVGDNADGHYAMSSDASGNQRAAVKVVRDDDNTVTVDPADVTAKIQWKFIADGDTGKYFIRSVATGQYLQLPNGGNAAS